MAISGKKFGFIVTLLERGRNSKKKKKYITCIFQLIMKKYISEIGNTKISFQQSNRRNQIVRLIIFLL